MKSYLSRRSFVDVITKDMNTREKRIQIEIFALRGSYENGELEIICWIPGVKSPAEIF